MVTVKEVRTKAEQKAFLEFPLDMYRDNPYFVPPLYGDEKKLFSRDFIYNDTCKFVTFLNNNNNQIIFWRFLGFDI